MEQNVSQCIAPPPPRPLRLRAFGVVPRRGAGKSYTRSGTGGGGVYGVEFLCHKFCAKFFVRNLFRVFKDLHGFTLGCFFAHSYHVRGFG